MFLKHLSRKHFSTTVNKLGVVGAGQMGTGIAIVGGWTAGLEVKILDMNEERLAASRNFIEKWCDKEISKERMTGDDKYSLLNRMSFALKFSEMNEADIVVEAVTEDFNLKKVIFSELAEKVKQEAILASNTSSISITKIAGTIPHRSANVIGMHFMNPVPVMKLVEVISGLQTSDATL